MVAIFTVLTLVILFGIYLVGCALLNRRVAKLEVQREEVLKVLKKEGSQSVAMTAMRILMTVDRQIEINQNRKRVLKWSLLFIGCFLLYLLATISKYLA